MTRRCAACQAGFTPAPYHPQQRYCSPRCQRSGPRLTPLTPATLPAAGLAPPHPGATAIRRCPHCSCELAVLTLLLVPAAAHVPTRSADG